MTDWTDDEGDGQIDYIGHGVRAERKHRQIIADIEACETPEDVYMVIELNRHILSAIYKSHPDYSDAIVDARADQLIFIAAGEKYAADTASEDQS